MGSSTSAFDRLSPALINIAGCSTPIVITGAGGWLGQATIALLDQYMESSAFTARVHVFGSNDRTQILPSGRRIDVKRLDRLRDATFGPAYYFHYAFLTKDRLLSVEQNAFIENNKSLGDLLETTILRNGLAGVFVPSSGAVYRRGTRVIDEDLHSNPYGATKIADERRFRGLAERFEAQSCIPRVFNLAGPFINKVHIYALSSIIADLLSNRPVVIQANHSVLRSYIHVEDLLRLAIAALFDPRPETASVFDTAGECVIEIEELAARVARVLDRPLRVIRPAQDGKAKPDRYIGDGTLLRQQAELYGIDLRDLDQQIGDTAKYLAITPDQLPR